MPDSRKHRGPDPRDADAFAPPAWPSLRSAVADLSWLLGRGYAPVSALKLVGDRWSLTERQRMAVRRCTCPDAVLASRLAHRIAPEAVRGQAIDIDGFNVLTTIEAALAGAVILRGRDGCDRDLAGVHGSYRRVEETLPALSLIAGLLRDLGAGPVLWLLDSPVSNSGRLRGMILETGRNLGQDWQVDLVFDPDPLLGESSRVVASADSAILDRCERWLALSRIAIDTMSPPPWIIDLTVPT